MLWRHVCNVASERVPSQRNSGALIQTCWRNHILRATNSLWGLHRRSWRADYQNLSLSTSSKFSLGKLLLHRWWAPQIDLYLISCETDSYTLWDLWIDTHITRMLYSATHGATDTDYHSVAPLKRNGERLNSVVDKYALKDLRLEVDWLDGKQIRPRNRLLQRCPTDPPSPTSSRCHDRSVFEDFCSHSVCTPKSRLFKPIV